MSVTPLRPLPDDFGELWSLGYRSLIPVIPPGAPISSRSSLAKRLAAGKDERGKAPGIRGSDGAWYGFDWRSCEADERDLARWRNMGASVGIKLGDGLVAIDVDAYELEDAALIAGEVERSFGRLPKRVGQAPKALFVCRVDGPFDHSFFEFGPVRPDGKRSRIEILGAGKQFVAYGIHPGTRRPYEWPRRPLPFDELPIVSVPALADFLSDCYAKLPTPGPIRREAGSGAPEVDQATLRGPLDLVRAAVAATPNDGQFESRESYRDFGYAIKASLPDNEPEALEIFEGWCDRWLGGENAREIVEADWRRFKPPFRIGFDWLCRRAEACSGGAFSSSAAVAGRWFETVVDVAAINSEAVKDMFGTPPEEAERARGSISATPYAFPAASSIPKRESLYGGHYVRQFVSTTVAPSKVGKSSLEIVEALAMASGKPLLGVQPAGCFRVWLWNGEDPIEELQRRICAAMLAHGLTREDVGDRLFVDTGRQMPIVLATAARDGARIADPVVRDVIRTIEENAIDVFQVDPFVSSHRVSENDNGAIDLVAKRWAYVADVTRSAVELVHHVRKLNGAEVTVEDGRGAVALIAASRSARAMARMTKTEAARLGLTSVCRRLFRFADTSSNLALPADGEAERWYELTSVGLCNGGGEDPIDAQMNGDSVGVVRVFDMPREAERALEAMGAGQSEDAATRESAALDELSTGEWRIDVQARDAWAGCAIGRAYGLDIDDPDAKAHVKLLLRTWIKDGKLVETSRQNSQRKTKRYVEVVRQVVKFDLFG